MRQIPDNLHFHYECMRCGNEFDLDGTTEWEDNPVKKRKRKGQ